jgi:hypothetical protein
MGSIEWTSRLGIRGRCGVNLHVHNTNREDGAILSGA